MLGLLYTHRLVFQGRRDVGGGVSSFAFAPEQPFEAKAGQHGILQVGGTAMKPFSLASAPEEGSVLIGTSLQSGSPFKRPIESSLIHVAPAGHAYRDETQQWAGAAAYPRHADDFRTAAAAAAYSSPGGTT